MRSRGPLLPTPCSQVRPRLASCWFVVVFLCFADLLFPLPAGRAKFEPEAGCYVGAFVEKDSAVLGDLSKFEHLVEKKHATYFTYVGYGLPFPRQWVAKVKAAGSAPHIAFEPNDGLEKVVDGPYLRGWARDAYAADCPIFLRFASEMNGNWAAYSGSPKRYIEKFRLVHDVMEAEAPNVAMVWTTFATPQSNIGSYYPGDDYVDWVGINIYSVYYHDGDPTKPADQEDPADFLRYIYRKFADRKPIQVSEFAATHFCRVAGRDTSDFATEKMLRFYRALRTEFPRVKAINWFSLDTIAWGLADNNYSLLDSPKVLETYRELVKDSYFLAQVPYDSAQFQTAKAREEGSGTLVVALPSPSTLPSSTTPALHRVALVTRPDDRDRYDWQKEDWMGMLATRGAVVSSASGVSLKGLRPGETVVGTPELLLVLNRSLSARYVTYEVDGVVIGVTNVPPFRFLLGTRGLKPGEHKVRAIVHDRTKGELPSEQVAFKVKPREVP